MNLKDKIFIEKISKLLNPDKWAGFLLKWANALESYGTPREFVYNTHHMRIEMEFFGRVYPFVYLIAPNNAQRRELMAKQKPYVPQDNEEKYGLLLNVPNCFLCQNVIQGIDAQNRPDSAENNVIFESKVYFILPNKYASQPGHSIFVPKNHDNTENRVCPKNGLENKINIYISEEGKTIGNILSEDSLGSLVEICEELNLSAARNHVLAAMSIPAHDHFHLYPEDSISFSLIGLISNGKKRTDFGANIYRLANTPFDTLVVCKENKKNIADVACPILEKMEKNNEVYTLVYHNNSLFITPRNLQGLNHRQTNIGAFTPIHCLDTRGRMVTAQEVLDEIKCVVPVKGKYNWERFIP